ncbi:hypothetical protein ACIPYS_07475 [Kitasatospora sp. NPDC089913]|uniref:hypothetical protein n=1 Tax=Kitasatospora sp. NPDC089913 TaxID=3364080 RepID=UPI00380C1FA0
MPEFGDAPPRPKLEFDLALAALAAAPPPHHRADGPSNAVGSTRPARPGPSVLVERDGDYNSGQWNQRATPAGGGTATGLTAGFTQQTPGRPTPVRVGRPLPLPSSEVLDEVRLAVAEGFARERR